MIRAIRLVVILSLFCTSFGSCTTDTSSRIEQVPASSNGYPESSNQEDYRSMDDSALLEGIDPKEIITDDWSDDGELELDVSE